MISHNHRQPMSRQTLVDLDGVSFLDSTGITALAQANRAAGGAGRSVIRSPQHPERRVLEITAMDQVLTIED